MRLSGEELRERVAELKRSRVPRASLARVGGLRMGEPETWAALIEQEMTAEAIDRYLRAFAWLEGSTPPHEPGTIVCPGCSTKGWFSWGLVYGAGWCSCGWPGRLYHSVKSPDQDTPDVKLDVLLWAHPYDLRVIR